MRTSAWIAAAASLLLLLPACPRDDDDLPPVDPVDYLVDHDGGTTGGPHAGEITVVVFDEIDKQPVPYAWVLVAHGASAAQAQTDTDGVAAFQGLTVGPVDVTAVSAGYANSTFAGINARIIAIPMERRRRLLIEGFVYNGSPSGTTITVDFETMIEDPTGGTEPKYGSVAQQPTGSPPAYEVLFDARAVDNLVFTETDSAGKIVNRKTVPIGPYTADQIGVNATFDDTTGLCSMAGTVSNLPSATIFGVTVTAWAGGKSYPAYSVTGSGTLRAYLLQVPPSENLDIVVGVVTSILGFGFPQAAQEFGSASGAADNASPVQADLAMDLVAASGAFLNCGAAPWGALVLKHGRCQTLEIFSPAVPFTQRMPRNVTARAAAGTFTGAFPAIVMDRFLDVPFGPFGADSVSNVDFTGATASLLALTTSNLPQGISSHDPSASIYSFYPDRDIAIPFYTMPGTAGGTNISFTSFGYGQRQGHTYGLVAEDADSASGAESVYIRTGVKDPSTVFATPMQITLLDVPVPSAPAHLSTQPLPEVAFSWAACNVDSEGIVAIEIRDASSGEKVWVIRLEHQKTSFTLPALPSAVSSLALQSAETYDWNIGAASLSGFDVDEFTFDEFPSDAWWDYVFDDKTLRLSSSEERTFSVQ